MWAPGKGQKRALKRDLKKAKIENRILTFLDFAKCRLAILKSRGF